MPEITIDVAIYCDRCGQMLDSQTRVVVLSEKQVFRVKPCQRCLEAAKIGFILKVADLV